MDEKVIIEFAKWITGHDEETIIQMYDDWSSSSHQKLVNVDQRVMLNFTEEETTILKSLLRLKILEAQKAIDNSIFAVNGTQKKLYIKKKKFQTILSKISE